MVYGCGFAVQKTVYDWVALLGDEYAEGIATSKEDLEATRLLFPSGTEFTYRPVAEAEPLENALALVKRQCYRIEETLEKAEFSFERLEVFLTGKGNYRDEIATIRPYKGNRLKLEKPIHYKAIRRYLRERWRAATVNGREADDEVAIQAASLNYDPDKVLIVSQDKDLRTVPGLLYNYRRNTYELITEKKALENFYKQIVTGDATDNIMGIHKSGAAAADAAINSDMTEVEMYATVLALCKASFDKKDCPYKHLTPEAVILEFGQLLHMQRFEGDIWQPPDSRQS